MRKGLYVILAFFMTVISSHYAYGQQEEFAQTLPVSYHIQSPYVVSAFPEVTLPLSVMKDTLGSPINILNVSYGERIIDITIDSSWKLISFTEYVDDEKSGYIIKNNNSKALAEKIEYFFESESSLKMKEYIKLNKDKFSWENHIKGIWELTDES